jgi:hypothetical protein
MVARMGLNPDGAGEPFARSTLNACVTTTGPGEQCHDELPFLALICSFNRANESAQMCESPHPISESTSYDQQHNLFPIFFK